MKPNEKEEKKEEIKTKPIRQIIIETNGDSIQIIKADVAGLLELRAIFTSLIGFCDQQSNK